MSKYEYAIKDEFHLRSSDLQKERIRNSKEQSIQHLDGKISALSA